MFMDGLFVTPDYSVFGGKCPESVPRKRSPKAFPESVRGVAKSDTHPKSSASKKKLLHTLTATQNVLCPPLSGDTGGDT